MSIDTLATKAYCNCMAQNRGLDPVGHAGDFWDCIAIELPLPWKRDMYTDENVLPQAIRDLFALWLKHYRETGEYRHLALFIAPDQAYSRQGFRRVMFYARPSTLFAKFEKVEYLVPTDQLGVLAWSLYQDRAALSRFEQYRVGEGDHTRDLLVCTHGTVDAACAKFGYPLYKHLHDTYAGDHLRVWRVSHFGGHVFAPTFIDMPTGHYWAYVEKEQAAQIVQRTGDVKSLRGHYRGWAGMDAGFLQTAECALWQQHGWDWFDFPKCGEVLAKDSESGSSGWADVRVRWSPIGASFESTTDMRVEVSSTIDTPHTTGNADTYPYPQYRVIAREKVQHRKYT